MHTPYVTDGGLGRYFHIGPRPNVKPELQAKRAVQDREMASFHAYLDAAAKDTRHKYERPQFIVCGEGSRSAQDNYRVGWERIFGDDAGNSDTL